MRSAKIGSLFFGAILAAGSLMSGTDARSDNPVQNPGVTAVYGNIPPDQVEFISTPDRIMSAASSNSPSLIWETLEHGEDVECLDCIPVVEHLMYDQSPETREIAAWWLRRRIFGVFGPGQAYERTVDTLKTDPSSQKRAYAAYALGEFLTLAGVQPLSDAISNDASPAVRAAAVSALGRLNDTGAGAVTKALGDSDEGVRLAAIKSASRINSFNDEASAAKLLGDSSALVRRRGVELLETLHATDTVAGVLQLAQSDADPNVRLSACHALGTFRDSSAKAALQQIAQNDASSLVRDQASIALRRM